MNLHPYLAGLSANAASSLISSSWEAALLVLLVAVCFRLVPGVTAAVRSTTWTFVLVACAFLPYVARGHLNHSLTSTSALHLNFNITWAIGITLLWAALSAFRIAQLIHSSLHLFRIVRRSVPLTGNEPAVSILARRRGRLALVCTSSEIDVPCVAGLLSPRILLPAHLIAALSPADLDQIVAHELAHLRRFDDWTNLFQKLLIALYPLHPVLLWIEHRLCVERELACDDAVLERTCARKQYALCLTNLAEHSLARRGFTLALRAWEHQSELSRRVLRILQRSERRLGPRQSAAFVATILTVLLVGESALSRAPQLVGFASPQATEQATKSSLPRPTDLPHAAAFLPVDNPVMSSLSFVSEPRPRLVRAVIKLTTRTAKRSTRSNLKLAAARTRVRPQTQDAVAMTSPGAAHGWVVLTTWQSADLPAVERPAILQDSNFSYAAVPTRTGWLIIQL